MTTGRGVKMSREGLGICSEFFIALEIMDHQLHGQSESEVKFACAVSKKIIQKVYGDSITTTTKLEKGGKKTRPRVSIFQSLWKMPLEEPRGMALEKGHMIAHQKEAFASLSLNPMLAK